MNEIERALATLQDLLDNSIFTSRIDFALEVAIEALREQAERGKGCEYCKPMCHNCKHDVYDGFCRYYGKHGCGNLHHEPKYNYCPVCGKKLEVKP